MKIACFRGLVSATRHLVRLFEAQNDQSKEEPGDGKAQECGQNSHGTAPESGQK